MADSERTNRDETLRSAAPGTGRSPTVPPPDAVVPERHPDAPAPGSVLPSHYDRCFGCGPAHPTGLNLTMVAGEGISVRAEFTVTPDHQGAPGLAHGGLLAAAFDEAMGAVAWLLRSPAVTGRLETDFVCPVPVGSRLLILARCEGVAGRKVYVAATGRLGAEDGPVAVRAHGLFVTVGLEHFRAHGRSHEVTQAEVLPSVLVAARVFDLSP